MKVLSNSNYITRQIGTQLNASRVCEYEFLYHKTNEIEDVQVIQKDLYPDANAVEDSDILDQKLPATQGRYQ